MSQHAPDETSVPQQLSVVSLEQHAPAFSIITSAIVVSFVSINFDVLRILSYRRMSMYTSNVPKIISLSKSPRDLAVLADQFKALGDPTRLALVMAVMSGENSEACVCDLTPETGLAQSTVSHHLKLLVDAGLLNRTQRGKWAYYSLTPAAKSLIK